MINILKINYPKISVSYDPNINIHGHILSELEKNDYTIIESAGNIVRFKYNTFRIQSRFTAFRRMDGGRFEIDYEHKKVSFSFYLFPLNEVIVVIVILYSNITQNHVGLSFLAFIILLFIRRLIVVKNVARDMMEDITNQKI